VTFLGRSGAAAHRRVRVPAATCATTTRALERPTDGAARPAWRSATRSTTAVAVFVTVVLVGQHSLHNREEKIMSERDGYGPVVPCWVAATPPDPGFGASTVNQPVVASREA
jgi:hypothetical protein